MAGFESHKMQPAPRKCEMLNTIIVYIISLHCILYTIIIHAGTILTLNYFMLAAGLNTAFVGHLQYICDCLCINHPFSAKVEFSVGAKVYTVDHCPYISKSENPNSLSKKSKQKTKNIFESHGQKRLWEQCICSILAAFPCMLSPFKCIIFIFALHLTLLLMHLILQI